jgi:hypothetical protein
MLDLKQQKLELVSFDLRFISYFMRMLNGLTHHTTHQNMDSYTTPPLSAKHQCTTQVEGKGMCHFLSFVDLPQVI